MRALLGEGVVEPLGLGVDLEDHRAALIRGGVCVVCDEVEREDIEPERLGDALTPGVIIRVERIGDVDREPPLADVGDALDEDLLVTRQDARWREVLLG